MRVILLVLATLFAIGTDARAEDGMSDTIEATILNQIEAFRAEDLPQAFAFASDGIRRLFRDPGNFGVMVREDYPMIWNPAKVAILDLREDAGLLLQDVEFIDQEGRRHVAEYTMTLTDDGWRIAGVRMMPGVQPSV